jgi:hypothetical protein
MIARLSPMSQARSLIGKGMIASVVTVEPTCDLKSRQRGHKIIWKSTAHIASFNDNPRITGCVDFA